MYRIDENSDREKYILLIPAMLDMHFPLLKYAFYSKNYRPVVLENEDNIVNIGLKYVNNDMCYPIILITGQMIAALQSGKYDLNRTRLLMPSAGDACRGSNYTGVLRRAVTKAGFPQVKVLALNLKGLEKEEQFQIESGMVWRALFGLFYGDILMALLHQTRPYEAKRGAAENIWKKWIRVLSEDIICGKHLTIGHMKQNFQKIAADFRKMPKMDCKKQRIGIVGEIYIKYCHLGNWNMVRFLEEQGCESHTNGLSWYAMYYMDSHLKESGRMEALLYKVVLKLFTSLQNAMLQSLRQYGFYCIQYVKWCLCYSRVFDVYELFHWFGIWAGIL